MSSGERVNCIIPAHNEAAGIGDVLEATTASAYVESITVVDDGSTDNTSEIALGYGVDVIRHPTRQGKGESMQSGYEKVRRYGGVLCYLDADLHNLGPHHVSDLVEPVVTGQSPMTIGTIEWPTKLQEFVLRRWGGLSGQRAMTIDAWEQLDLKFRAGNRVEAALNLTSQYNGWNEKIKRVKMPGVTHTSQWEKRGPMMGTLALSKIYGTAALTYAQMWLEHCAGRR